MQFLVGKFTCEMSLDDGGNVVARWFRSDARAADVPKKTRPPLILCAAGACGVFGEMILPPMAIDLFLGNS
jgi:hypothetical protein